MLTPVQSAAAYVFNGTVITLGNLLIILAIALPKELRKRKELIMIASLSFGDMVLGLGYACLGSLRLHLYSQPVSNWANYTSFDCLTHTPITLFFYGAQTMCVMMVVVSIDRVVAVVRPAFYYGLTSGYAVKIFIGVYLVYGPATVALALYGSYRKAQGEGPIHLPVCYGTAASTRFYYLYHTCSQTLLSLSSCLIYVGVLVVLFSRTRQLAKNYNESGAGAGAQSLLLVAQRRQDRVTKLLGFVILTTLILFTIPYVIVSANAVFGFNHGFWLQVSLTSWILSAVNSVCNVMIYILRHPDIRASALTLICRGKSVGFGGSSVKQFASVKVGAAKQTGETGP